ncbi:hypothetical protein RIF29_15649 [Crotalaria pallida]|uniref:Protein kinase domain-containing protein n=1 Tax=Crotalaria pallida TaxID=3830 RepID=A0AAN9IBC6_CROPI
MIRNLGALGYRAPELATASRPVPSFQANVYAFGVILMEISTGKSADSNSSHHPRIEFVVSISDISTFKLDSGLRSPTTGGSWTEDRMVGVRKNLFPSKSGTGNGSCNGPTMDKVEEEVQSKRTHKLRVLQNLWSSNIGPTNLKHMGQNENEAEGSQKGEEGIENKQGKKLITTSSHQKAYMDNNILASVGAVVMIVFALLAYHRAQFHGRGKFTFRDVQLGRLARPSFPTPAFSFSTDHILSSESRSLSISGQSKFIAEITELGLCQGTLDTSSTSEIPSLVDNLPTSSEITLCPDSPLSSFPCFMPNLGNINSLDRLTGDLLFSDCSLSFTEAELADAPAEVLGTSSHGTLNKVTLDSGHVLTAKRLRQTIRVAVDVARGLTDYGLHGLMTPAAIAEKIRNLGALGYCAPELATASKPVPSFQANVYAFGVILIEISTGKSAGDLILGQPGAVYLREWVRLCERGERASCNLSDKTTGGSWTEERMVGVRKNLFLSKSGTGNESCNGPTMDRVEEEVQSKRTQKLRVLQNLWSSNIGPTNLKHMGQKENEAEGSQKANIPNNSSMPDKIPIKGKHHSSKGNIRIEIILASVEAVVMIVFALLAYHRAQFHGRGKFTFRDVQLGRLARPSFPTPAFSFSTDHILSSESRSLSISGQSKFIAEITELGLCQGTLDTSSTSEIPCLVDNLPTSYEIAPCPNSPLSSFPRFMPNLGNINSPNWLTGDLLFLDCSLSFTEAKLADAPTEVLGTSSHGTLNKVTLDSGHVLTAKRLQFGIFERKMDFVRGARRIGSMRHPNINPLRACYLGPWEYVRILYADYIHGDSLALHLYDSDSSHHPRLEFVVSISDISAFKLDSGLSSPSRVYELPISMRTEAIARLASCNLSDKATGGSWTEDRMVGVRKNLFPSKSGTRNGSCNGPTMDKVEEEVQSKRTQKLRVLQNLWSSNIGPTNLKHMGQKENDAEGSQKGEEGIENKQGKNLITTSSHQKVDMVGQTHFLISNNVKGTVGVQYDRNEEKVHAKSKVVDVIEFCKGPIKEMQKLKKWKHTQRFHNKSHDIEEYEETLQKRKALIHENSTPDIDLDMCTP